MSERKCTIGISVTKSTSNYAGEETKKEIWDYEAEGEWSDAMRGLKKFVAFLNGELIEKGD